ncbi:MAG: tyrosine-type recombinase/integrase [Prevotella sp.]
MVEKFLTYLSDEMNRSPRTVESYSDDLRSFEEFFKGLDHQLSWDSVDADVIRDWMECMMEKGNSASSVARRLSALHSFFRFLLKRNLVKRDPSHGILAPKQARPLPQFVKESEMNRLIDDVEWGTDFESVRARTIIIAFYETGMRVSELTGLNDAQVDFINMQLRVTGKGNKQRIIPFGDELFKALQHYQQERDKNIPRISEAFFVTDEGDRMNYQQVRKIVQRCLGQVTTLKKRSPHVLRHSFATAMLNHNADIESVKRLLGHESVSTTEIYTHTTFEQLKRVYNDAHPRA